MTFTSTKNVNDYGFRVRKKIYRPYRKEVRLAPLQKNLLDYIMEKKPEMFSSPSDYIRKAITLQAKTVLPADEFEYMCAISFKEQDSEKQ